ncbi:MAG: protein-(glutamine-N5) methyltransferase, release factor-specific, partial [Burkholderiaceae bacterium]
MNGASVGALLRDSGLPALEARALLAGVLDCPRERLVAHPEAAVPAAAQARFEVLAAR